MRQMLAAMVVALLAGSVGASTQDEISKIERLYADYRSAVEAGSIEGYVSVLHPDVRLLPPGAEPIDGAERYAKFLEPVLSSARYRIEVISYPAIEVMGEVAVAEYVYLVHLSLNDPDVAITEEGALSAQRTRSRYLDVLRKKENGDWAIWRHTWNVLEEE